MLYEKYDHPLFNEYATHQFAQVHCYCIFEFVDLEGRSDDKIRIMEVVEELRSKRADKQVRFHVPYIDTVYISHYGVIEP